MNDINGHAGRIPKKAFIATVLLFLGVSVVTAAARFFIRIRYQRQVSADDGFLLFGLCCMISSVSVIFVFIDSLYLFESIEFGANVNIPVDFIEQAWAVQKYSTISLVLCWCSIVSVKFSFLVLFRKLVDRVRVMKIYWWAVAVFNAVISLYGVTVYFIACPHFYSILSLKCGSGPAAWRADQFAISQIVLDVFGDLLILYIPVHLILRIQIRWTQKLALLSSLCLTLVVITVTIVKASGLRHGSEIDTVWEIYFQTISAEVGLIMTAVTAFRAFFVARNNEKSNGSRSTTEPTPRSKFNPKYWLSRSSWRRSSGEPEDDSFGQNQGGVVKTGISTFIQGSVYKEEEEMMPPRNFASRMGLKSDSKVDEERDDDLWPLQDHPPSGTKSIMVKQDISFLSERNSLSMEFQGNRTV